MQSIYVFREVGLERVQRHEEFDLYLYSVSPVPHDVCTCVFARLVYLLPITERGLVMGWLVSLNRSWDVVSRKSGSGISVKIIDFFQRIFLSLKVIETILFFRITAVFFLFRAKIAPALKGPFLKAPIIKSAINCRARIFAKLVLRNLFGSHF